VRIGATVQWNAWQIRDTPTGGKATGEVEEAESEEERKSPKRSGEENPFKAESGHL